jgi:hypothetical protein
MRIVPVDYEPKEDDIAPDIHFDTVSVEYINYEGDCVSDAPQTLNIFTENNGVKRFIVFNTDRFAISNIDELIQIFNDFKKKAEL